MNEKQTNTQMTLTLNSSTATDTILTNDAQTGMCRERPLLDA